MKYHRNKKRCYFVIISPNSVSAYLSSIRVRNSIRIYEDAILFLETKFLYIPIPPSGIGTEKFVLTPLHELSMLDNHGDSVDSQYIKIIVRNDQHS